MARERLKRARQGAGMTQEQAAERLGISLRHYCRIESGEVVGKVDLWDALEDLFSVHQRMLRETEEKE